MNPHQPEKMPSLPVQDAVDDKQYGLGVIAGINCVLRAIKPHTLERGAIWTVKGHQAINDLQHSANQRISEAKKVLAHTDALGKALEEIALNDFKDNHYPPNREPDGEEFKAWIKEHYPALEAWKVDK